MDEVFATENLRRIALSLPARWYVRRYLRTAGTWDDIMQIVALELLLAPNQTRAVLSGRVANHLRAESKWYRCVYTETDTNDGNVLELVPSRGRWSPWMKWNDNPFDVLIPIEHRQFIRDYYYAGYGEKKALAERYSRRGEGSLQNLDQRVGRVLVKVRKAQGMEC